MRQKGIPQVTLTPLGPLLTYHTVYSSFHTKLFNLICKKRKLDIGHFTISMPFYTQDWNMYNDACNVITSHYIQYIHTRIPNGMTLTI